MTLTRSGATVTVAAVVLLAAGAVLNYPELVLLGIGGGTIMVLAVLRTSAQPAVSAVRELAAVRVPIGEPVDAVLTVRNRGRRRSAPLLAAEQVGGRSLILTVPSLAPGADWQVSYPLPTGRRGRYRVEAIDLRRTDPLRLLQGRLWLGDPSIYHVHPIPHRVRPLPAPARADAEGPAWGTTTNAGVAFHSLRPYQPGDDIRLIHWMSSARSGSLQTRLNVVTDAPNHVIILDTRASNHSEASFEEAVRIAASLSMAAIAAGHPLEVWTTDGRTVGAAAGEPADAVLDLLAEVNVAAGGDLSVLAALARTGEAAALAVVTGLLSPGDIGTLAAIRRRFRTVSVVVVAPPGESEIAVADTVVVSAATSAEFAALWRAGGPR